MKVNSQDSVIYKFEILTNKMIRNTVCRLLTNIKKWTEYKTIPYLKIVNTNNFIFKLTLDLSKQWHDLWKKCDENGPTLVVRPVVYVYTTDAYYTT